MATYSEQIEYERELQERGARLYYDAQDALRGKGHVEDTDAMRALFKKRGMALITAIEALITHNHARSPYKTRLMNWIEYIPVAKLAYFTQYTVMRVIDDDNNENIGMRYLCQRIGEMIETEARCITFELNNKEYYRTIQESFKKDNVSSYDHKRKVIRAKMKDVMGDVWEECGMAMRVGVGALLLNALLMVFKDMIYMRLVWVTGAKSKYVIETTVEFDEWLADYEHQQGLRAPHRMPMKVPPMPWVDGYGDGGYITQALRYATPFINPVGKKHREFINRFNPVMHKLAANKLQEVPYELNKRMFVIIEKLWTLHNGGGIPNRSALEFPEIPERLSKMMDAGQVLIGEDRDEFLAWKAAKKQTHRDEIKRRALVRSFVNTMNASKELVAWDEFYYVWTACFRGRLYPATAALHPQGHESARSLLLFKHKLPLGNDGILSLAAHGGGLFGIKGDRTERAQWAFDNKQFIQQCADSPLDCSWKDADKPLHFLAWCLEWSGCDFGTEPETLSGWIGGIDGTNNGLQHLSAIARDQHGAYITNLTASAEKQDAYKKVADRFLVELGKLDDGVAEMWLNAVPGRDLAKMPMMILVYGATKQTCRKHCIDWVHEHKERFPVPDNKLFDIATYGADILWRAIEAEIPLVIQLMNWLQANSTGRFVKYISPLHFPMYQYYMKAKMTPVATSLAGSASLACYDLDDVDALPNNYKQRLGIVPNLTHLCDSTHLVMVVNEANFEMCVVHDEYQAHCCNIAELQKITIQQFHKLHTETDVLKEWAIQQGISVEHLPERGTFDVDEVKYSKHLFE